MVEVDSRENAGQRSRQLMDRLFQALFKKGLKPGPAWMAGGGVSTTLRQCGEEGRARKLLLGSG